MIKLIKRYLNETLYYTYKIIYEYKESYKYMYVCTYRQSREGRYRFFREALILLQRNAKENMENHYKKCEIQDFHLV